MLNLFKLIYIFILLFELNYIIKVEAQLSGTCVALPDNKVVLVNGNQAWEYHVANDAIQKYQNNGPKPVTETEDSLPHSLTAALEVEAGKYYFFRKNRFCIRKIEADKSMTNVYEEEEDIEIFSTDSKGNKVSKSVGNFDGIETIVEEKSKCVWKSNGRLFACFLNKDPKLNALCKDPTIIGALGYKNQIYLLTLDKVYQFDGVFNALYPLGKLVNNDVKLNTIWKHFTPKRNPFFTHEDQLFIIEDYKVYYRYNAQAMWVNKQTPIKEVDQMVNINGAPIVLPGNRIAVVSGNHAFYYQQKDGHVFKDGKISRMNVQLCPESFPPKITGSFTMDMNNYLFFRGNKFCERKLTISTKETKGGSVESENTQVFKVGAEGSKMVSESGEKIETSFKSSARVKQESSQCVWKDTRALFRCQESSLDKRIQELCDKPTVYAIIMNNTEVSVVGEESTFVFKAKSSSYFTEFLYKKSNKGTGYNPKHNGIIIINREILTITAESTFQKWKAESLQTPEPQQILSEETYKKMMKQLTTTTVKPKMDIKISETLLNRGCAMILPFRKVAIVRQDRVWYFKMVTEETISQTIDFKSSVNVKDTAENFPPFITAAFTSNQRIYYFFRDDKYCKRPLIIDKETMIQGEMDTWQEYYQVDPKTGKKTLVNKTDESQNIKVAATESTSTTNDFCNWKPNTELFGCADKEIKAKYPTLCDKPSIIGTVYIEKELISVFTTDNIFRFQYIQENTNETSESKLIDKHFKTFVSKESLMISKYQEFDAKAFPFFTTDRHVNLFTVNVEKNGFRIWSKYGGKTGKRVVILKAEPEEPDRPEELSAVSAIIADSLDLNSGCFKMVVKDMVFSLSYEKNKFVIKQKQYVVTNGNQLVAAIKSKNQNWYFINNEGKYCKETDSDFTKCREWHSNERLFGCYGAKILIPELKKLCDNPKISAAVTYGHSIFVFRNGKYWEFNNLARQTKPLGDLVDGPKVARKKWPNIVFPSAMGHFKDSLVTFKDRIYNQWSEAHIHEVVNAKIVEHMEEFPDEPEGPDRDGGALVHISGEKFAKINKNKICYLFIKKTKASWCSHCMSVKEDARNFPKDIVAAIVVEEETIYFIRNDAKYCKRDVKTTKSCDDFKENSDLFGCSKGTPTHALKKLCAKPKITSGSNYRKQVLVFRGGKYWQFDGKASDQKPLGNLIRGDVPAKKKWKKIRFPAGLTSDQHGLVAIYGNSWSRWPIEPTTKETTPSVEDNEVEAPIKKADGLDKPEEADIFEFPIKDEEPADDFDDGRDGIQDLLDKVKVMVPKEKEKDKIDRVHTTQKPSIPKVDTVKSIPAKPDETQEEEPVDDDDDEKVKKQLTTMAPDKQWPGQSDVEKPKIPGVTPGGETPGGVSDEKLKPTPKPKETGNGGDSGGMYCVATTCTKVRGGFTCKYSLKNRIVKIKQKCVPNDEEWHRFPSNLVAIVIIETTKYWYLFNNEGKFCKRAEKDYDECKVWLNNKEAFGCDSINAGQDLGSLCDNVEINAGGNVGKSILIFRGGKYWEFDGKPVEGKPLGELITGSKVARDKYPKMKFPGAISHQQGNLVMIYDKTWSLWSITGKPEEIDKPIMELEATTGTAIAMSNNKIGIVHLEKTWYFRRTPKIINWNSAKKDAIKVDDTFEEFPKNIDAAFSFNNQVYYFFKGTEYCKRPLVIDEETYADLTYGEWVQSYERPDSWYKMKVADSEKEKFFTCDKKDGHCIWRDTYKLLGCENKKFRTEYMTLCSHPRPIGTMVFDKTDLYFFTQERVYIMNGRTNSDTDLNTDSVFSNIRSVTLITELHKKWRKFEPIITHFLTVKEQLCEIRDKKKYICWDREGNPLGKDIGDAVQEPADKEPNGEKIPTAVDFEFGQYVLYRDTKPKIVAITDNKTETTVDEKKLFEKNIIAIIRTSDDNQYNVREDGKYCKYIDKKCTDWLDNKKLLGCEANKVNPDLKSLCDKPKINAGLVFKQEVLVFRGGKYWKFDNKPKLKKPIGNLVEGPVVAEETFPKIKLPAAMGQIKDNLFNIVEKKYNEWTPNGTHVVVDRPITEKQVEASDEPDGNPDDSGALICLENHIWAKVTDNQVCYFTLRKDRLYRDTKCFPVTEDDHQFPANIIAAVMTANDIWYYFDKEGKHCTRPEGDHSVCNKWVDNKELFPVDKADTGEKATQLQFLRDKPKISAGGSGRDAIYLFRGGKYWLFDNKPKPNKPFGELVEGGKPAKTKWPRIHFPGGVGEKNEALNVVYKHFWISYPKKHPDTSISEQRIRDEPLPDIGPKDLNDMGAAMNPDNHDKTFKKIKKDRVCRYDIKNNVATQKGRCVKVAEDKNNYPAYIVAAIINTNKMWFFINKNGMYCKRKDGIKDTCDKFRPNSEIFGCSDKADLKLEPLCDNTTIDSGGNIDKGKEIAVFRGGKVWIFDNKPTAAKPLGALKIGGLPAVKKWPDIHLPAGIGWNDENTVALFGATWRPWSATEPVTEELPYEFEDESIATAVPLPNQKFIVVHKNESWYFRRKGTRIIKGKKDFGPHQMSKMPENLPSHINAAYTDDFQIYYFFRYNKFCKRPLNLEGDRGVDIFLDDWYGNTTGSNSRKLTEAEMKAYFDISLSADSFCIWKSTQEVFADCQKRPITPEIEDLCFNPFPVGVIRFKETVEFFREDKSFIFSQRAIDESRNFDNRFSNLNKAHKSITDLAKGFNSSIGQFLMIETDLYQIDYIEKKYKFWQLDGKTDGGNIGEAEDEPDDVPDGDAGDAGALLIVDQPNDLFKKVSGKEVCPLAMENNKLYFTGKCVPVKQDAGNYPEDIIAAIVNRNNDLFLIRPNGVYCKRPLRGTEDCTEWRKNVEIFGCEVTKNPQSEMKSLCDKPTVTAGGNLPPLIYVFRGGKYWQFDNKPQPGKPLGNLLDSAVPAKDKWNGIHFPGGFGHHLDNPMMVYKTRYSTWSPEGKPKDKDRPIDMKVLELPDEPELNPDDRGALIDIDQKKKVFAKILVDKICYVKVVVNQMFWKGNCRKVDEDENNFPPEIVAVITTSEEITYIFDEKGKFCKRPKKSVEKCKEWRANSEAFGCAAAEDRSSSKRNQLGITHQELMFLCKNTKINAGTNFGPYIFVFRGGKYWKFDNKPKKDKPLGELVIGQQIAKDKWPGIHFPVGLNQLKPEGKIPELVAVYKDKWSKWPSGAPKKDKNAPGPGPDDTGGPGAAEPGGAEPGGPEPGGAGTEDTTPGGKVPGGGKGPGGKTPSGEEVEETTPSGKGAGGKTPVGEEVEETTPGGKVPGGKGEDEGEPGKPGDEGVGTKPEKGKGKPENIIDQPIEKEEPPDEPDGNPEDMGALLGDDDDKNVKTQIKGGQVCNLVFRGNKCYRLGPCVPVDEDRRGFPPDIVAAIQNKNKDWFFISNDGKFCKRKDKSYEKCREWNDNRLVLGCGIEPMLPLLESLCENPRINAGGNGLIYIQVFRGGKRWEFDNKPEPKKPFGNIVSGAKVAKKIYPGIKFPGAYGTNINKPVMVYNNTWSQWLPNNEPDLTEEPILELDNSPGVAILLPFDRVAVVVKWDAHYYRKKGKNIYRDSEDTSPIPVEKTVENFPPDLSAVYTTNKIIYHFFKGTQFCKRPLIVESNTLKEVSLLDWNGDLPKPDETRNEFLPEQEASKYFKDSPKDCHCIWRDNRELLDCKSPKVSNTIRNLCSTPITIGTISWDKHHIYVFTHSKLYLFDLRGRGEGLDLKAPDFSRLVSDSVVPNQKWKGFNPNYGRFFAENNLLCVITDHKHYSCWDTNGDLVVNKKPIGPPEDEVPDDKVTDDSDAGALINPPDNEGKYTRIRGKKVCNLTIEFEDMYFLGSCVDTKHDSRHYPPDIIAAIKPKDNHWYFFNKKGKYCKRPQFSVQECKEWNDNKEPFGCNTKLISPQLKHLCNNVVIHSGGNYPPAILVFRGGKLFKFNNRPKPQKPFGDLVEGGYFANTKYPGIHLPAAIGYNEDKFVAVYKKHWSQWRPKGINDVLDLPIMDKENEIPDQPDMFPEDIGALIPTNDKDIKAQEYGKIKGNKVCFVVIRKNKLYWKDSDKKCVAVSEDKNNFPPDIVAAIKPDEDVNWYYIRKDGTYCKRPDKHYDDCKTWNKNEELFGCKHNKRPAKGQTEGQTVYWELLFLCKNTKIVAGGNYPPYILVFRGGKYWKFDNKPKPNKPFGNLVEGQVPARLDFPGIHFPGGAGVEKPGKFIMVYNDKWSRWKPKRGRPGPGGPGHEGPGAGGPGEGPGEEEGPGGGKPGGGKPGEGPGEDEGPGKPGKGGAEPGGPGGKRKPSDDNDVNDDVIRDEDDVLDGKDGREDDAGALIPIDETIGKFAKVIDNRVCYLIVKKDRAVWSGECVPVTEDTHNYPPYIVAAIRNGDNDWFYIKKDGQYCQRKHNRFETCDQWNDNREIFGCNTKGVTNKLNRLCSNVKIKAGTQEAIPKSGESPRIWVFRGGKFWIFDNRVQNKKPFGEVIEGGKLAGDLWDGIHFPGGAGFDNSNFIMVYKNKWSRWTPDDANETLNGKADDDWLKNYKRKLPQLYPGGAGPTGDFDHPEGKTGAGGGPGGEGPGGGKPSGGKPSGGKPSGGKPADDEGGDEGPGGKPSGGKPDDDEVDIHKKKKQDKKPSAGTPGETDNIDAQRPRDVYEAKIGDEMDDLPKFKVGTDGDSALIRTNVKLSKVSKVIGDQICHYFIRDKLCYQRGNCTEVTADRNNFPAHIVAAIEAKDHYWYFISTTGKYCRRHIKNVAEECTKWTKPDKIYGCDTTRVKISSKFSYLCRNSKINAGANYPPYIYLFKDGMYWKFNNKYSPKRPFGEMIDGAIPARNKFPLIHFPGAASFFKKYFVIIYKNKWSRWKPEPASAEEMKGLDDRPDGTPAEIEHKPGDKKGTKYPSRPGDDDDGALYPSDKGPGVEDGPEGAGPGDKVGTKYPSDGRPGDDEGAPGDKVGTKYPSDKKPGDEDETPGDKVGTKYPSGERPGGGDDTGPGSGPGDKDIIKIVPDIPDVSDDLIRNEDAEPRNEPERDAGDSGALIPMDDIGGTKPGKGDESPDGGAPGGGKGKPDGAPDDTVGIKKKKKYAKIFETKVCYLEVEQTKAYWVGKCLPVDRDANNFPPNIIAYIKTKAQLHYFINKKGEYCVRPDANKDLCQVWKDNREVFGCNAQGAEDYPIIHRYLCENPVINAGGVHDGIIYIFRGGKQWKFDNKPKTDKPFGDLINGGYRARDNWTDIHFPGGAGTNEGDFIMVYKKKWSRWKRENKGSSTGDIRDVPIGELDDTDYEMENKLDLGALILIDDKKKTYRKIKGDDVCPLKIKSNVAYWDGKCKPVTEEEHNYPGHIVAAIKTAEPSGPLWYLIKKDGKYCKRPVGSKENCNEWRDNIELFLCKPTPQKPAVEFLCDNPQISAGGNVEPYIIVFKRGKFWVFNNKPKEGKPLGDLVSGDSQMHTKYPGMHLPGGVSHNGPALVIVYNKKWSQWKPDDAGPDDHTKNIIDTPIIDEETKEPEGELKDMGALIKIEGKKGIYGKIVGGDVCYLLYSNFKMYYEEPCKPVKDDKNNFPPDIVAYVKTKKKLHYFFDKHGKHCVRVDLDYSQCNKWSENSEAFGCKADNSPQMAALCDNTAIKAGGNLMEIIYVLRGGMYWQFDNEEEPNKPLGKLVVGNLKARDKWPEIHVAGGLSYSETSMIMVYRVKWSIWPSGPAADDTKQLWDQPIHEKDKEEEEGDMGHTGALINLNVKLSKYAKIKGPNVCKLQVNGNLSVWTGPCKPVDDDEEQFPPFIYAAIRTREKYWYYLNDKFTYCKRPQFERSKCTTWNKNNELFGCEATDISIELKDLCDNPKVTSGGNYPPYIYIFRGTKYWKFDDKGGPGKPFGDLVVGKKPASEEFHGIHLPGGVSFNRNAMIIVYNNTWSQWKPTGNELSVRNKLRHNDIEQSDAPIGSVEFEQLTEAPEAADQPETVVAGAGGGLFPINEKIGRFVKIVDDQVCYYKITDTACTLIRSCERVSSDKNNYPPNIVAVIKDRRKNLIFFDAMGKHCQRSGQSKESCSQWKSNSAMFGCDSANGQKPPLSTLCSDPKITAGTNVSPFIYFFRGGKYWKFNNRPKPGLPIGECVEGGKPAKKKWPGIRFPGGAGYKKSNLIMVYKKLWSIWSTDAKLLDKKIDSSSEPFLKEIEAEDKASAASKTDETAKSEES